jgi:DNA mismatch repair protein MutS2
MNASVEFDLETLSPTYHLTIGLPGGSQAFAIAERLGLPATLVADARSRLSESQLAFEATLARIRETEGETADALERSRAAEARAADALRAADEERRKARESRTETERIARDEAERLVAELRAELERARRELERGQLTAPGIDAVLERAEDRLGRVPAPLPAQRREPARAAVPSHTWKVGEMARSRSGGWTGRVAELDRSRRRATLEAGSMRVSVEVADLEPADGGGDGRGATGATGAAGAAGVAGTNVEALRAARARTVPMSLDVRGARVEEALAAVERYLEDASLAGLARVTLIHGLGTGALRDAVREDSAAHPLVRAVRAGERGEGGDGVTVVELG